MLEVRKEVTKMQNCDTVKERQHHIQDPWERKEELQEFIKNFPGSPLCECCRREIALLEEKEW